MEGFVKWALIGAGVYLLYTHTATAAPAPATTTPAATGPFLNPEQLKLAQVIAAVGDNGPSILETAARVSAGHQYNVDQWNYYLPTTFGIPAVNLNGYLVTPGQVGSFTAQQFWNGLKLYASGAVPSLNGLAGLASGLRAAGLGRANNSWRGDIEEDRYAFAGMGWQ